jgi:hypothetical protein
LARHGEERISPEEFDRHFGSLPTSEAEDLERLTSEDR